MKCPDCGKKKTDKVLHQSKYRKCLRCGLIYWARKT